MRYGFLIDTYETERLKAMSAWAAFQDQDLPFRPHPTDRRGRSVLEHMVHQCVSEDAWFKKMLGIDVGARPLPHTEARLDFIRQYATDSRHRSTYGPTADTGGLGIHDAPTIYAYADEAALLQGEAAGGRKAALPGPTPKPPTERPGV